jgi:hypothetical protein
MANEGPLSLYGLQRTKQGGTAKRKLSPLHGTRAFFVRSLKASYPAVGSKTLTSQGLQAEC